MKRILLILILVIILVSLNWFVNVNAGELDTLSQSAREQMYQQWQDGSGDASALNGDDVPYHTPKIFGEEENQTGTRPGEQTGITPHQAGANGAGSNGSVAPGLTPFEKLEHFGQDLFRSFGPGVLPPDDIASSDDYILGPGDNLIVYLWGRVEQQYQLTLDREGKIVFPKVGELSAWGMSLGSFKEAARKKLSAVYSDFDLAVSLGRIRSIRIYLTGEVNRPGAYTVSSLTSLFNALYLGGGPTENGSMRAIRVMRAGKLVAEVDLYRFLLAGDNSLDVSLKSGDAIFVPVAGHRVAIRGQVRRPAIYELNGQETVSDLIELAGRSTADAYLDRVMLERVADRNEWEVLDLDLSETPEEGGDNPLLMDGDRVSVFSIYDAKKNMVAIYGLVQHPGKYERNDSTRVSSLLQRAGLQPYGVHYERANLFRKHSDWNVEIIPIDLNLALAGDPQHDQILRDSDSLHVYSQADVEWEKYVHIDGEIKRPGDYPLYQGMTVKDLIFLSGSFTRSASTLQAELARVNPDGEVSLLPIDLTIPAGRNLEINEGDRLYIRQVPNWRMHRTVKLSGAVSYPGEYVLAAEDETLYQLIGRAGGLAHNAFPTGLIFERNSIDSSLRHVRVAEKLQKSSELTLDTLGRINQEEYFEYDPHAVNRIILDVDEILASQGARGDIILEPGDEIQIPTTPSGITVMGAVGSTGTTNYSENKSVKYYVQRVGNFTRQADKKGTLLIRASGEVYSGGSVLSQRVHLGDVIVVPTRIKRAGKSFGQSLTTVLTATTGILTTVLLIDRL